MQLFQTDIVDSREVHTIGKIKQERWFCVRFIRPPLQKWQRLRNITQSFLSTTYFLYTTVPQSNNKNGYVWNTFPHNALSSFYLQKIITHTVTARPPLWSSGQSFWLQTQRSRVRFPALTDFLSSSGSGTGSTQPREVNWGATWIKSSGSGLENRD